MLKNICNCSPSCFTLEGWTSLLPRVSKSVSSYKYFCIRGDAEVGGLLALLFDNSVNWDCDFFLIGVGVIGGYDHVGFDDAGGDI